MLGAGVTRSVMFDENKLKYFYDELRQGLVCLCDVAFYCGHLHSNMPALELIEKYYNTDWTHRKQVFMTASSHCLQNFWRQKYLIKTIFRRVSSWWRHSHLWWMQERLQTSGTDSLHTTQSSQLVQEIKSVQKSWCRVQWGRFRKYLKKHQIIFLFIPRSSRAHPRTEIMYLLVLPASLAQVEKYFSEVVHKYFSSIPGQTECDTQSSETGASSAQVKTESSNSDNVKKYLFSDAQTNTVSSSGTPYILIL